MKNGVGAVVVAGSGPRLVRTLGCLAGIPEIEDVTIVVPSTVDPRVVEWIDALAAARSWKVVATADASPGRQLNAGVEAASAEWVFLLDAGETLTAAAPTCVDRLAGSAAVAGFIAGAVRLIALGVDEIVHAENVAQIHALDPASPVLRGMCWRRPILRAAGGLDPELPAGLRYDLWLRLVTSRVEGLATDAVVAQVGVGPGDALREELGSPAYGSAVQTVLTRHLVELASSAASVLEHRERRLAELKRPHMAAVDRRAGAIAERRVPGAIDPALPLDPAADGHGLPRRTSPRSRDWGYERGGPLDRVYIEQFLAAEAAYIQGAVLEVQEADYTRRFGGGHVSRGDVVDVDESNREATVIADLRMAANIASDSYDCIIITQTLHVIDDMPAVVAECHRMLRAGGVVLATLPCVSRVCLEYGPAGDLWRVTPAGARRLFELVFGTNVTVTTFGNALATSAFTLGLGRAEVRDGETAVVDPYNPTLVGVRAVKQDVGVKSPALATGRHDHGLVLLYHRVGGAGPDPHRLNLSLDAFERQMAWLASDCAVLSLDELVERADRRALPSRAVAITFDDGYVDTLTHASPILSQYRLPATCFVATEGLDGSHVFWWDRLAALFLGDGVRPDLLSIVLPDGAREIATVTPGERLFGHALVYNAIAPLSAGARARVLAQIDDWAPQARVDEPCRRMSADELRALALRGIALGAHTVGHPHLPLLDRDSQVREIAESRRVLERIGGVAVTHLAYPHGAFDETTATSANDAGITHAFTCEPRALVAGQAPLRLPRLDPQESRLDRFIARVALSLVAHA